MYPLAHHLSRFHQRFQLTADVCRSVWFCFCTHGNRITAHSMHIGAACIDISIFTYWFLFICYSVYVEIFMVLRQNRTLHFFSNYHTCHCRYFSAICKLLFWQPPYVDCLACCRNCLSQYVDSLASGLSTFLFGAHFICSFCMRVYTLWTCVAMWTVFSAAFLVSQTVACKSRKLILLFILSVLMSWLFGYLDNKVTNLWIWNFWRNLRFLRCGILVFLRFLERRPVIRLFF